MTLAIIGVIYGARSAIGQTDMMRLPIAYLDLALQVHHRRHLRHDLPRAQSGSTQPHAQLRLSTAAVFLIAGFLIARRGGRSIADYGGVRRVAPILRQHVHGLDHGRRIAPGLAPFISEFLDFCWALSAATGWRRRFGVHWSSRPFTCCGSTSG